MISPIDPSRLSVAKSLVKSSKSATQSASITYKEEGGKATGYFQWKICDDAVGSDGVVYMDKLAEVDRTPRMWDKDGGGESVPLQVKLPPGPKGADLANAMEDRIMEQCYEHRMDHFPPLGDRKTKAMEATTFATFLTEGKVAPKFDKDTNVLSMKLNMGKGPCRTQITIYTVDEQGRLVDDKQGFWQDMVEGDKVMLTLRYSFGCSLVQQKFHPSLSPCKISIVRKAGAVAPQDEGWLFPPSHLQKRDADDAELDTSTQEEDPAEVAVDAATA